MKSSAHLQSFGQHHVEKQRSTPLLPSKVAEVYHQKPMNALSIEILKKLPVHRLKPDEIREQWQNAVRIIHGIFQRILVVDDDPTGSQTVYGIPVYTGFSEIDLLAARREDSKTVYVLTNSRSLDAAESEALHLRLMANWEASGKAFHGGNGEAVEPSGNSGETLFLSRSDSTLRGHYPLETGVIIDSLRNAGTRIDGEIFIPFFPEGGRFTIGDIHYVREGELLVPAGETEFARDSSFSYKASNLTEYISEKSGGTIPACQVVSVSLESLRAGNIAEIAGTLARLPPDSKVIVNAVDYDDLRVFSAALAASFQKGRRYVFRCAASLVKVLAGLEERPLLERSELFQGSPGGSGLIVAGSYVGKTTKQLAALKEKGVISEVSLNIRKALVARDFPEEILRAGSQVSRELKAGRSVCLYTSNDGRRDFLGAEESEEGITDLELSSRISRGLVDLVRSLATAPAWVLTKGGITSHDIAEKALGVRRALVLGQLIPGVPVWRTGTESRWPGIPLIIFPGNVGDDSSLARAVEKLIP